MMAVLACAIILKGISVFLTFFLVFYSQVLQVWLKWQFGLTHLWALCAFYSKYYNLKLLVMGRKQGGGSVFVLILKTKFNP